MRPLAAAPRLLRLKGPALIFDSDEDMKAVIVSYHSGVTARRLDLLVPEAELAAHRASWTAPSPRYGRGCGAVPARHVSQANDGCDFDFLAPGEATPEPEIN